MTVLARTCMNLSLFFLVVFSGDWRLLFARVCSPCIEFHPLMACRGIQAVEAREALIQGDDQPDEDERGQYKDSILHKRWVHETSPSKHRSKRAGLFLSANIVRELENGQFGQAGQSLFDMLSLLDLGNSVNCSN
jgi:hypothetical protein